MGASRSLFTNSEQDARTNNYKIQNLKSKIQNFLTSNKKTDSGTGIFKSITCTAEALMGE